MKLICTVFFLGLALMPLSASGNDEIDTHRAEETGKKYKIYKAGNGQVYRDVTVTKITDAGVTIMHASGSARLGFENLSPEQRKKFGITKENAKAIYTKEMKARAAYEAQVAAVQKKRQEEGQKAHEELIARQEAALEAQQMQEQLAPTEIVSTLEVPGIPVIRGYDNQIYYPVQNNSRPQRKTYRRSSGYGYPIYYGGYGGSYGYGGTHCYPSRSGYYRSGYRGYSGWIGYRGSNFSIRARW